MLQHFGGEHFYCETALSQLMQVDKILLLSVYMCVQVGLVATRALDDKECWKQLADFPLAHANH